MSAALIVGTLTLNGANAQTPDPRAILERAAAACARVSTIEYEETHRAAGSDTAPPLLRATVRQQRAEVRRVGFLPGRFRVEGTIEPAGAARPFGFSYDGQVLRILDVTRKRVQVARSANEGDAGRLLGEPGMVGMPQFTDETSLRTLAREALGARYEGRRTIAAVVCDVVALEQTFTNAAVGTRTIRSVWYIGVDDGLPRGNSIAGVEKQLRIVSVNAGASADSFDIQRPADFTEVAITGKEADVGGLIAVGEPAPDWTLADANGGRHSLSDMRGQVVLLDFWGTWCVPCLKTMPAVQALHERFAGRGLRVFGVAVADSEGDPRGYMKRQGYTYTLLMDGDAVAQAYRAVMLPTLYVIGRDGRVLHAERGYRQDAAEQLTHLLDLWLAR